MSYEGYVESRHAEHAESCDRCKALRDDYELTDRLYQDALAANRRLTTRVLHLLDERDAARADLAQAIGSAP